MEEVWFDPRHTGALRIIRYDSHGTNGTIEGSDPAELRWTVPFERVGRSEIAVDFAAKKTHHGRRHMRAVYTDRRNTLAWPDSNRWRRVRVDPRLLLCGAAQAQ